MILKNKSGFPEKKEKGSNLFLVIVFSVIFGLISGAIGAALLKTFFLDKFLPAYNQEIDFSRDNLRQANLFIENAKKIIVEQDNKAQETVSSARSSLVGIFLKKTEEKSKAAAEEKKSFSAENFYQLTENIGEGLIVTSDGWVLANDFVRDESEAEALKKYVVITKNKNVYTIDEIRKTGVDSYYFIHLAEAKDLPVKSFFDENSLSNSQLLVAVNWQGESFLSSVVRKNINASVWRESDISKNGFLLFPEISSVMDDAFIFNLNGEVIGLYNKKAGNLPIGKFQALISGLLKKNAEKRAYLGLSYVNLSDFAIKDPRFERGALISSDGKKPAIEPNSPAASAGLKEGDIILSVNNIEISENNDLADILEKKSAGDEINLVYRRAENQNIIKIILGEAK